MKKNMLKRVFAAFLVTAMALSITACGGVKADDTGATEDTAQTETKAMTDEEYEKAVTDLATEMTGLQSVDMSTPDAAKGTLNGLKDTFTKFAAIKAPEKYIDAHKKFSEGANSFNEYIDIVLQIIEDPAKATDLSTQMTEAATKASNAWTEGSELMTKAHG